MVKKKQLMLNYHLMVRKHNMESTKRIWPRIWAFIIDIVIVYLLCSLICSIRFLNPTYEEYNSSLTSYQESYNNYINGTISASKFYKDTENVTNDLYKYGTSNYVIYFIVLVGYFVLFPRFSNGQTIGKKINKIKIVTSTGDNPSTIIYLLRLMFIFIIGLGGIFSILACSILPHILSSNLATWISAVTITNMLLSLIDLEFLLARKDKRSLHDIVCNTLVIEEPKKALD